MCYLGEAVVSVLVRGSSVSELFRGSSVIHGKVIVRYLGEAVVSVLFRGSSVI